MKKTYIQPDLEVIVLRMKAQLLDASNIEGTTNDPNDLLAPSLDIPSSVFDI